MLYIVTPTDKNCIYCQPQAKEKAAARLLAYREITYATYKFKIM